MASSVMNGSAVSPMSSHVLNTTGRMIIITSTFLETSSLIACYLHIGNSKTKVIIVIGGTHSSAIHGSNTRTSNSHFTRATNNSLSGYSSRNSSGHFFYLLFIFQSIGSTLIQQGWSNFLFPSKESSRYSVTSFSQPG